METSEGQTRDSMISEFCSITGVEAERGQFYLDSTNWNLQLAIQSFFEHSDDTQISSQMPHISAPNVSAMIAANDNSDDDNDNDVQMPNVMPNVMPESAEKPPQKVEVKRETSKFATLDSLRAAQDSGASSEEEGQAFYAGGSTRSGQQVLGPKKKNTDEYVADVFKSAKEHGAEVVDPNDDSRPHKRIAPFVGVGHKLDSSDASRTADEPKASSTRADQTQKQMVLKFWKNGFSIDDEPLRPYENPENQEFLSSIRRGEIPRDLLKAAHGRQIDLNMEDHKNEDYVQPKKKLQAFTGEGYRLGSPAADLLTAAVMLNTNSSDLKACEQDAQNDLKVDESSPITSIQIRLADGSRLVLKINLSKTIADIRQFICTARPAYSATPFVLMTTFPNRELNDETLTIKEANLINASIVQRIQ